MHLFRPRDEIPPGHYGMVEFYCPDPACECRRVMLNVVEKAHPDRSLASISYGFDREDEDAGPYLDPFNPQCSYAEQLLQLVEEVILSDSDYVARLERHYALVKLAAADPRHPAYPELQTVVREDAEIFPLLRPRKRTPRIGRNDPCPCGSGKKYKQCCGRQGRQQ
jgi:hypothetical protein